jgi:hypothetical protein
VFCDTLTAATALLLEAPASRLSQARRAAWGPPVSAIRSYLKLPITNTSVDCHLT